LFLLLQRALADTERGLGYLKISADEKALRHLAAISDGDARKALNSLEIAALTTSPDPDGSIRITLEVAEQSIQKKAVVYDGDGDAHYDTISAFIKSMRGSDPDATLYWLAKMIHAGEDPRFITRRMVIAAAEDVGLADPFALTFCISCTESFKFLGSPEGELAIAQAVIYLATAPKSVGAYRAFGEANEEVEKTENLPVPLHIRNAPTRLMKEVGYGDGYIYPPDSDTPFVDQTFLPDNIADRQFYHPTGHGREKKIAQYLAAFRAYRAGKK